MDQPAPINIEFKPLMTEEEHREFARMRETLRGSGVSNVAQVFVPVAPAAPLRPRLMIIGKATRDYGTSGLASFDGAAARDAKILQELPLGRSAFWQFARSIIEKTLALLEKPSGRDELVKHCAWTNLAKIGDINRNPPPASLETQRGLCRGVLREEIKRFDPDAIVLVSSLWAEHDITRPVFEDVAAPVFGFSDRWRWDTPMQNRIAYKRHGGAVLLWTDHPQGLKGRPEIERDAAAIIAGWVRRGELPEGVPPVAVT